MPIFSQMRLPTRSFRQQLYILPRQLQVFPHKVKPVATKERLAMPFALGIELGHPEPRAPERALLLNDLLCDVGEFLLVLRTGGGGEDGGGFG